MRVLGEITDLLNLAWCCLQASECTPGRKVVLVAFLFHGNYANAREALTRTFLISGLVIGLHLLLKAIYLFGFGVELFIDDNEHIQKFKWGLWVIHKLLLAAIYGMILQLLIVITARPAFYKYITCMLALNGLSLFACALAANGAHFGLWLYGITSVCYHSFYLPLLYVTFLADFFQEEDLNLENVYYSEMKDAGFFDADWE
ncbi:BnaC05g46810D [Brassica napus]|uniref:BnaC05g46810D protein n=1 Tax=Brassica napus TaxID=3708 RepID=A0A078HYX4_BRANA|nr:BnaC05g46810D [Brassica napus]